jgi:hypothetical protein
VAGRTGDRALTGAFEVDVPFVSQGEEVVALVTFDLGYGLAFGVLEGDLDAGRSARSDAV